MDHRPTVFSFAHQFVKILNKINIYSDISRCGDILWLVNCTLFESHWHLWNTKTTKNTDMQMMADFVDQFQKKFTFNRDRLVHTGWTSRKIHLLTSSAAFIQYTVKSLFTRIVKYIKPRDKHVIVIYRTKFVVTRHYFLQKQVTTSAVWPLEQCCWHTGSLVVKSFP